MEEHSKSKIKTRKSSIFYIGLVWIVLLITAIVFWVVLKGNINNNTDNIILPETGSSGTVLIAINNLAGAIKVNIPTTLTLTINAGSSKVAAASVEFIYDASKLQVTAVNTGDFFSNVIASPKIENGKVSFAYGAAPDSGGTTGTGTIATVTFKSLLPGSANIAFTSNTKVSALETAGNVLKSATGIVIDTLNDPVSTPVPTTPGSTTAPTITPTATIRPTATHVAAPTATHAITTATPTPVITVGATGTLIPTEEPTSTPVVIANSDITPTVTQKSQLIVTPTPALATISQDSTVIIGVIIIAVGGIAIWVSLFFLRKGSE